MPFFSSRFVSAAKKPVGRKKGASEDTTVTRWVGFFHPGFLVFTATFLILFYSRIISPGSESWGEIFIKVDQKIKKVEFLLRFLKKRGAVWWK